ncbi:hypothetical protein GCM10010532_032920 [Dactylosporangium siamense]|uniref:Uncharacterized protein n=1 Tax=Dactylosporangium siamense TaxID=685454 RepID=A0A919PKM7_9ACTN|nr:hypothetical protein Dsi01nite_017990 [Dactylosporangium siamense]
MSAGGVSTSAAIAIRTVTTAPGDQPVAMSAPANGPDVPNIAADANASPSPAAPRARPS